MIPNCHVFKVDKTSPFINRAKFKSAKVTTSFVRPDAALIVELILDHGFEVYSIQKVEVNVNIKVGYRELSGKFAESWLTAELGDTGQPSPLLVVSDSKNTAKVYRWSAVGEAWESLASALVEQGLGEYL